MRAYVERGEGETADVVSLSAKFERAKFFSDEFFPYALYYLGLLTFADDYTLGIPNLTLGGGDWRNVFEQFWLYYVKARIPAQAFDKMNENFFRTTFTSRCLDCMPRFYSFETEYNTAEGRCDFLAIPKPGFAKHALLIAFKYFTKDEVKKTGRGRGKGILGRTTPDEETARQARDYVKAVTAKPDWGDVPLDAVVVEVCSDLGYNWLPL